MRQATSFGGSSSDLEARFDMGHVALYGQLERPLSGNVKLMVRGRVEHSSIDYRGETNAGAQDVRYDVGGWLPGGKVSVNWKMVAAIRPMQPWRVDIGLGVSTNIPI